MYDSAEQYQEITKRKKFQFEHLPGVLPQLGAMHKLRNKWIHIDHSPTQPKLGHTLLSSKTPTTNTTQ